MTTARATQQRLPLPGRRRICKVVMNVHMGMGHHGLSELLREQHSLDVTTLSDGDLVMFINTAGDKLKLIGGQGKVLGYLRMPRGQKLMFEAIQFIPRTFGSAGLNYDQAVRMALTERLGRPQPSNSGPLNTARAMRQAGL